MIDSPRWAVGGPSSGAGTANGASNVAPGWRTVGIGGSRNESVTKSFPSVSTQRSVYSTWP